MFVYSMKASTIKFFGVIAFSVAALVTLLTMVPKSEPNAASLLYSPVAAIRYDNVKTEEGRVTFLKQFGWNVQTPAVEEAKVTIPAEFDRVFTAYNELQKLQGLDLSRYQKKEVTRYTYILTNFPDYSGTVYANLLVYRGKIIGGDICTADMGGFIRGFDGVTQIG